MSSSSRRPSSSSSTPPAPTRAAPSPHAPSARAIHAPNEGHAARAIRHVSTPVEYAPVRRDVLARLRHPDAEALYAEREGARRAREDEDRLRRSWDRLSPREQDEALRRWWEGLSPQEREAETRRVEEEERRERAKTQRATQETFDRMLEDANRELGKGSHHRFSAAERRGTGRRRALYSAGWR
ncbi:hypothetical protein JCM10450v2_008130 [Rhodotorula kratochvilovae]